MAGGRWSAVGKKPTGWQGGRGMHTGPHVRLTVGRRTNTDGGLSKSAKSEASTVKQAGRGGEGDAWLVSHRTRVPPFFLSLPAPSSTSPLSPQNLLLRRVLRKRVREKKTVRQQHARRHDRVPRDTLSRQFFFHNSTLLVPRPRQSANSSTVLFRPLHGTHVSLVLILPLDRRRYGFVNYTRSG